MKKILNNKMFLILALFLFFLLINANPVRAEDVLITSQTYNKAYIDSYIDAGQSPFDGFKKIVDIYHEQYPEKIRFTSEDLPQYAILIETFSAGGVSDGYRFIFSEYPLIYNTVTANSKDFYLYSVIPENEDGTINYYVKGYVADGFTDGGFCFGDNEITSYYAPYGDYDFPCGSYSGYVTRYIASNHDILNRDGSLVFQQPTLREATTLAPVIQREKTKGTLQVTLKEIVLILPLILVAVVSFLGLRKALKILFQVLRRS